MRRLGRLTSGCQDIPEEIGRAGDPLQSGVAQALVVVDRDGAEFVLVLDQQEDRRGGGRRAADRVLQLLDAVGMVIDRDQLAALGQAGLLIGKENLVRVDAPETPDPIGMDDYSRAKAELPAMARSLAEASGHHIEQMFLKEFAEPYEPFPYIRT